MKPNAVSKTFLRRSVMIACCAGIAAVIAIFAGDVIATLEPIDGTELRGLDRVVQAAERAVARSAKEIEDATRTLERAKDAVENTYRRLIEEELGWARAVQDAKAVLEDREATLAALQADPPSDPQPTLDAEAAISDARNALAEAKASLEAAREAANERLDEEALTTAREALAAAEVAHAQLCDAFEIAKANLAEARNGSAKPIAIIEASR